MKVFIYKTIEGNVCVGTSVSEDVEHIAKITVPINTNFFIVESESLPSEPQDAWVLQEDGSIIIDQEKVVQIKRQQMIALTKRQFNLVMYDNGLLTQVKELLSQNERTQIEFDSTDTITRLHPTVIQLAKDLGLTEERVDELWAEALVIN